MKEYDVKVVSVLRAFGVLVLTWLFGCDRDYGIIRGADLTRFPDPKCVRRVLDATPGLSSVREASFDNDAQRRASQPGDHHYFFYEGPRVEGHLAIIVEEPGHISFRQSFLRVAEKPPQDMIDATRAVMRSVEKRLEAECEVAGLSAAVYELCLRVKCIESE